MKKLFLIPSLALGLALSNVSLAQSICSVSYKSPNNWGTGAQEDLILTNTGSAVSSWELCWTFKGAESITNGWNSTYTQNGNRACFKGVSYNNALATNATASFGFVHNNMPGATPTDFTLNGVSCAGAPKSSSSVSSVDVPPASSVKIEAESWIDQSGNHGASGVQTQGTSDVGGGLNVGWIDAGDWTTYPELDLPCSGSYLVEYRVAGTGAGQIQLEKAGGSAVLGSISFGATGDWQKWATVSHIVANIPSGKMPFGLAFKTGGFNLNWFRVTPLCNGSSSSVSSSVAKSSTPTTSSVVSSSAAKSSTPVSSSVVSSSVKSSTPVSSSVVSSSAVSSSIKSSIAPSSSSVSSSSIPALNGQTLFVQQCAGCHDVTKPAFPANKDLASLTVFIRDNMPLGNPAACGQDCAAAVANYLLTRTFTSSSSSLSSSSVASVTTSSKAASSIPPNTAWVLNGGNSFLNYVSTKKTNVTEVNKFKTLSGTIDLDGLATVTIDMNSVDTANSVRDGNVKNSLYETATFPTATISVVVPNGLIASMAVGSSVETSVMANLTLHGVTGSITTTVLVQRLTANRILVQSLAPVIVKASDYGMAAGLEALRVLMNLASINNTVPVDFQFVFDNASAPVSSSSAAASSSVAAVGCASMSNTYACLDFEDTAVGGTPAGWYGVGGRQPKVTDTNAKTGGRSLKVSAFDFGQSGAIRKDNIPAAHYGRIQYRFDQLTPADYLHTPIVWLNSATDGREVRVVDLNSSQAGAASLTALQYLVNYPNDQNGASSGVFTSFNDSKSSWHCVEWQSNPQNQTYTVWVDGVQKISYNTGNLIPSGNYNNINIGMQTFKGSEESAWIDDVVVGPNRIGCN